MKLTKKQRIAAILAFILIMPIALVMKLIRDISLIISTLFEHIAYQLKRFDFYLGEKYDQFINAIK